MTHRIGKSLTLSDIYKKGLHDKTGHYDFETNELTSNGDFKFSSEWSYTADVGSLISFFQAADK